MYIGLDMSCGSHGDTTATAPDAINRHTRCIGQFTTTTPHMHIAASHTAIPHRLQEARCENTVCTIALSWLHLRRYPPSPPSHYAVVWTMEEILFVDRLRLTKSEALCEKDLYWLI
jgi:hypothetical protein